MAKAALRSSAIGRRAQASPQLRSALASRLATEGLKLAATWRPRVISAFYPIRDEPDTLPLLSALADAGYSTALPVTTSRGEPLLFRAWRPGGSLTRGAMNIPEPLLQAPEVDPDLLFVPLAAFDRRGHRIGFGAGHYDRTLAKLRAMGSICAVGAAFSVSEIPAAPTEPHDEPLDFILTERELIDCRGSSG